MAVSRKRFAPRPYLVTHPAVRRSVRLTTLFGAVQTATRRAAEHDAAATVHRYGFGGHLLVHPDGTLVVEASLQADRHRWAHAVHAVGLAERIQTAPGNSTTGGR